MMKEQITEKSEIIGAGMKMPVIGLGTWQASSDAQIAQAIDTALEIGYRHIDTATVYMNESSIGQALKKWFDSGKIRREDLFIVTKLPQCAMQPHYVEEYLKDSLHKLQLTYVDLYLIHHPVGIVPGEGFATFDEHGRIVVDFTTDHLAIWKAMETQVDAGRTKAIGLSNFNAKQTEHILKSCRIPPATNQIEMYLYFQQKQFHEWSKKNGVPITAYGPLGSLALENFTKNVKSPPIPKLNPLEDLIVLSIAKAHRKTPAQVLLRHLLQLGVAVIPKSSNPKRIKENFEVFDFELNDEEMLKLNSLDKGLAGQRFVGGAIEGLDVHPEYPY